MNTVITHFYNEEYMLPWWINHHKKLFDYGILIDYNSTDRSYEICKELCPPHWKIVKSVNREFNIHSVDTEVKMYESTVEGFKMTLTVTEFLLIPNSLEHLNYFISSRNIEYMRPTGVCMVDIDTENLPTHYRPLIEQKHHGMINSYYDPINKDMDSYNVLYARHYHNQPYGNYLTGRHFVVSNNVFHLYNVYVLKYKYSPWNKNIIDRLYTYEKKLKDCDDSNNISTEEFQNEVHKHFLTTAHDLRDNEDFKNAYNYCVNL